MEIRRIVVGVDGSDNARRGLEWAASLARVLDAEVIAVHAVGLLAHLRGGPAVVSEQHREEIRALFEEDWCKALSSGSPRHKIILREGNPVTTILDVAGKEEADLIVMGSRGEGGFSELHLGSTSHQVAQYAQKPVVIIPPAEGLDFGGELPR